MKITFGELNLEALGAMVDIEHPTPRPNGIEGGNLNQSVTLELQFDPPPLVLIDGELMRFIGLPEPRGK